MKILNFVVVPVLVALTLIGCAEMQQKTGMSEKQLGTAGGATLGCVGGAILAKATGGNALTACAAGAVVGGFVGFEKARQEEIAAAEQAKNEAVQAFAALPKIQQPRATRVKNIEVIATDKKTKETSKYQTFDSLSIEIPLSSKGTPERETAMAKLRTLAERVADERGSAEIIIGMQSAEMKSQKIDLSANEVKTAKGNTITVRRAADASAPKGSEIITVKAGKLQLEV